MTARPSVPRLRLLTLNIGNPSVDRAERQLTWLAHRPEDVFVLTETRASRGCALLAERFAAAGYAVHQPDCEPPEYGTMIVSKVAFAAVSTPRSVDYLPARMASVVLAGDPPVELIGMYVPSRDAGEEKTQRKRRFLDGCAAVLRGANCRLILLGDLNVLEPDHRPAYPFFLPFEYDFYRDLGRWGLIDAFRHLHGDTLEYSWVGRSGDGYRYDHAFVSTTLLPVVEACAYIHEPRLQQGARLSDHSALSLSVGVPDPHRLTVSDPSETTVTLSLF